MPEKPPEEEKLPALSEEFLRADFQNGIGISQGMGAVVGLMLGSALHKHELISAGIDVASVWLGAIGVRNTYQGFRGMHKHHPRRTNRTS